MKTITLEQLTKRLDAIARKNNTTLTTKSELRQPKGKNWWYFWVLDEKTNLRMATGADFTLEGAIQETSSKLSDELRAFGYSE